MAISPYWTALQVLKQVAGELGLPQPASVTGLENVQSIQLLSLLNSSGNELEMYYPWEQFTKEWVFQTEAGMEGYDLPDDWLYFRDQTQWDRTNHWPLLGPKSPQEWAWLKGALVAQLPRQRFRVANNKLLLWPIPTATDNPTPLTLAMEYIIKNWVEGSGGMPQNMIIADGDLLMYNPWLLVKFVKFKFYDLKGFSTTGVSSDFMRIYNSLTGKDVGGRILSLSQEVANPYLGPRSVPDGSWNIQGA